MRAVMSYATGRPVWTWPDWRQAKEGQRFEHNRTKRQGTFIKPSKVRNNGAIVRWDGLEQTSHVVSPARDLTPITDEAS